MNEAGAPWLPEQTRLRLGRKLRDALFDFYSGFPEEVWERWGRLVRDQGIVAGSSEAAEFWNRWHDLLSDDRGKPTANGHIALHKLSERIKTRCDIEDDLLDSASEARLWSREGAGLQDPMLSTHWDEILARAEASIHQRWRFLVGQCCMLEVLLYIYETTGISVNWIELWYMMGESEEDKAEGELSEIDIQHKAIYEALLSLAEQVERERAWPDNNFEKQHVVFEDWLIKKSGLQISRSTLNRRLDVYGVKLPKKKGVPGHHLRTRVWSLIRSAARRAGREFQIPREVWRRLKD